MGSVEGVQVWTITLLYIYIYIFYLNLNKLMTYQCLQKLFKMCNFWFVSNVESGLLLKSSETVLVSNVMFTESYWLV